MKSPKFPFAHEKLNSCINVHTIKAVWKSKILLQLRKQIMRDLVEYRDYTDRLSSISQGICLDISRAEYVPRTPRHYLVEKSRGLCRQMTIAAPRDLLVFQCLTNHLQKDIVKNQPTKKAYYEPGQAKFNKDKIHISTSDYGSLASWKRFQTAIFEFSKERPFVVVTDVANFYDFINLLHLRNIVSSICFVDEAILDFLIYLLEGISWRPDFMPRSNIGLPQMEAEAPRVLANAMLFELDRVADKHGLGDYVRFMDDIDVGVDTTAKAKAAVRDIDLTLQARQLRLNSSKTKILSVSKGEVSDHFCIKENKFLDYCTDTVEDKFKPKVSVIKALNRAYGMWKASTSIKDSRFLRGNAEKIFKRVAILYHKLELTLPVDDNLWFIQNVPSLRVTCFDDLARHSKANSAFHHIADMFYRRVFVDDASSAHFADFIVHARFDRTTKFRAEISNLLAFLVNQGEYMKSYSALIIASKFLTPSDLLEIVKATQEFWISDVWLGRIVGGLAPLMARDSVVNREYTLLCHKSNNVELEYVLEYHWRIATDMKFAKSNYSYALSPNPSYPGKLIYPKVLTILSIFQNPGAKSLWANIKKAHPLLTSDPQYRDWFK